MEIGHQAAKEFLELFVRMLRFGGGDHSLNATHDTLGENAVAGTKHFRVNGGENVLGAEEHLLVQLFARSHAGELDLDVGAYCEAGEPDQIGCDIDDANGLTHVEQENLAASPEGASLKHQLYGFRYGHEVPLHLGVCHGDRATGADLTKESGCLLYTSPSP